MAGRTPEKLRHDKFTIPLRISRFLQNIQLQAQACERTQPRIQRVGRNSGQKYEEPIYTHARRQRKPVRSNSGMEEYGKLRWETPKPNFLRTLDLMKYDTTDNKSREQRYKDEIRNRNKHTKDYPQLEIGQKVLIQHHSSGEWYKQATITQVRADAKSYWLIYSEGRKYLRGRRLIKPITQTTDDKF